MKRWHVVNVTIKSAIGEEQHAHAVELAFRFQVQQRFLNRAQRHRAIHRVFCQRISLDI